MKIGWKTWASSFRVRNYAITHKEFGKLWSCYKLSDNQRILSLWANMEAVPFWRDSADMVSWIWHLNTPIVFWIYDNLHPIVMLFSWKQKLTWASFLVLYFFFVRHKTHVNLDVRMKLQLPNHSASFMGNTIISHMANIFYSNVTNIKKNKNICSQAPVMICLLLFPERKYQHLKSGNFYQFVKNREFSALFQTFRFSDFLPSRLKLVVILHTSLLTPHLYSAAHLSMSFHLLS